MHDLAIATGLDCSLLDLIDSILNRVHKTYAQLFSRKLLLLQTGDLLSKRIVTYHPEPILEISTASVELDRGNINTAQHSDKVGQVSSRRSCRGSYRSVEIERILRGNISKYTGCFLQGLGPGHQPHFRLFDANWFRFRLSLFIIP